MLQISYQRTLTNVYLGYKTVLKGEKERRKVCEGILKVCESDKKYFESVRNDILKLMLLLINANSWGGGLREYRMMGWCCREGQLADQ